MNTKHLPLIIGIALPLVFIIIMSLVLFTPSFSVKPKSNFIYSTEYRPYDYYSTYKNTYEVERGRLVLQPVKINPEATKPLTFKADVPPLYLYDVRNNTIRKIDFAEAQNWNLNPGPSSRDGYIVEYRYNHDGIFELFGSGNNNNGHYVSKGNARKRLEGLSGERYWNDGNFRFIGWVE